MCVFLSNRRIFYKWGVSGLLVIGLLSGLIFALNSCQSTLAEVSGPPKLIKVIDLHDPWQVFGTEMSVLSPDGLLYVINSASVAVIDNLELSTVITIPGPEGKVIDPRSPDYPETWGDYPKLSYLAFNETTNHLHVLDEINHQMTVISGTNIITTVDSGGEIPKFITFDPKTGLGYLSNLIYSQDNPRRKQTIVLSDTQVITRLERGLGLSPESQIYNPIDGFTYLGHNQGKPEFQEPLGGVLTIIDGTKIITTTNLGNPDLQDIKQIVTNRQNGNLYMQSNNKLVYWDRENEPLHLAINVPHRYGVVRSMAVDSRTNFAYAPVWGDNLVLVIDKNKIVGEIPVYEDPYAIAIDEQRDYMYVANRLVGALSIIRGTEVITTVGTGGIGPSFITLDEDRGYIYVSNADSHSIAVFGFDEADEPTFWQRFLPFIQR